jgi:hypothetical protein
MRPRDPFSVKLKHFLRQVAFVKIKLKLSAKNEEETIST